MPPEQENVPTYLTRKQLAFGGQTTFALDLDIVDGRAHTIEVRGFTKEGPFTFTQVLAVNTNIQNFLFPVPDIPVAVSVNLSVGSTTPAIAHAVLYLNIDGNRMTMLSAGMINGLFGVAWPHQMPQSREQSEGATVAFLGTNPAAGQELNDVVPDNEVWEILAISLRLVCNATVADRTVQLILNSDPGGLLRRTSPVPQQASETMDYLFFTGGTSAAVVANTETEVALPARVILPPGTSITTATTNIQSTDNYSEPEYLIRKSFIALAT